MAEEVFLCGWTGASSVLQPPGLLTGVGGQLLETDNRGMGFSFMLEIRGSGLILMSLWWSASVVELPDRRRRDMLIGLRSETMKVVFII